MSRAKRVTYGLYLIAAGVLCAGAALWADLAPIRWQPPVEVACLCASMRGLTTLAINSADGAVLAGLAFFGLFAILVGCLTATNLWRRLSA